jgi:hypothetical protein
MTARGTRPRHPHPEPSDAGAEWRWRNYTERLTDLYDLRGGARGPGGARPGPAERDAPESKEPRR